MNRWRRLLWLSVAATAATLGSASTASAAQQCGSADAGGGWTLSLCLNVEGDAGNLGALPMVEISDISWSGNTGKTPRVQRMIFTLTGQGDVQNGVVKNRLLIDYAPPFRFKFPTAAYKGGTETLAVKAAVSSKSNETAVITSMPVTFTGSEAKFSGPAFTPHGGTSPGAGKPTILAAVGDGAGGEPAAESVIEQIDSWNPNLFLYTGDVYDVGTQAEFLNWYDTAPDGTKLWGRFRDITNPVIGNHDSFYRAGYGYFDYYWKTNKHYYSTNSADGNWHIIALDSTRKYLGYPNTNANATAQLDFINTDLAANSKACTIAIFHHPRWDVGPEFKSGDTTRLNPIWKALANHGVDIVLNGHDHQYQRWMRLDANGDLASEGTAEFVVGTGGHGIQSTVKPDSRVAKAIDAKGSSGALRLVLNQYGANFEFRRASDNAILDAGAIPCSGRPKVTDNTRPTKPAKLNASAPSPRRVKLTWRPSTDAGGIGIRRYVILRNGVIRGRTTLPRFTDVTRPGHRYRYVIRAVDFAGNTASSRPLRVILGSARANRIVGSAFADLIFGFGGADTLKGAGGNDRLVGGAGNDRLFGGPGRDTLVGGLGRDTLFARDGVRDVVNGGGGRDRARVDRRDAVRGVEVRF